MIEKKASKIGNPENYERFYPGVYSPEDKAAIDRALAERLEINNRGPVDIQALVSGKLDDENLPGINKPRLRHGPPPAEHEQGKDPDRHESTDGLPEGPMGDDRPEEPAVKGYGQIMEDTSAEARNYDPDNRLYFDADYARSLGYENVPVYPLNYTLAGQWGGAMPKDPLADTLAVNGLNRIHYFYKPVYPGDRLYAVEDRRDLTELTPPEGNEYRTFRMWGHGKVYNQNGVCVGESIGYVKENLKRYIVRPEGYTRQGFDFPWDSANWWARPAHHYTDEDWASIRKWWAEETRRGTEPLYWEDVAVGVSIPQKVVGPITEAELSARYGPGNGHYLTMKEMLTDPVLEKNAVKDPKTGLYTHPSNTVRGGGMPGFSFIDRPVFENSVCPHFAISMLYNWMGDRGWLYKIAWDIMSVFPGYDGLLPDHPDEPHYIRRVPFLKGKTMWTHGLGNDLCIARGYIERKFIQNDQHMVSLIWWLETIEGDIFEEGEAIVVLPSRNG